MPGCRALGAEELAKARGFGFVCLQPVFRPLFVSQPHSLAWRTLKLAGVKSSELARHVACQARRSMESKPSFAAMMETTSQCFQASWKDLVT